VVKVLADGTYLSVLINPKIRGARHRKTIMATASKVADRDPGAAPDDENDPTELDPAQAHLVRVVDYDVPDPTRPDR
jgi:hypothetical protein